MIDISDYYLDIKELFKLPKEQSSMVEQMYNKMIDFCFHSNSVDMPKIAQAYFNTLQKSGYLKNKKVEERDEKIDQING